MARRSNLLRRDGTYYARIYFPVDLQQHFGSEDRKVSLRTKNEAEARTRLNRELGKWDAIFDDIRSRRLVTSEDKAAATWTHYTTVLENDDRVRLAMPTQTELDVEESKIWRRIESGAISSDNFAAMINAHTDYELLAMKRDLDVRRRTRRLDALKVDLQRNRFGTVNEAVQDFINKHKLIVDPASEDYRDLCRRFVRAEIEALARTLERDRGEFGGLPKDPIVMPAAMTVRERAKPGEGIMDLFEIYARENPRGISADTLNQAERDVGCFADLVGKNYPVNRIDKKAVREWKALLQRFPVKATETKAFEGMKIEQIVKHNETIGKPTITPRTVNRYLSGLGAYCNWLVAHGYLDQNPTEGMSLAKEKKISTLPFTNEQLNVIFSSPLFTGCESDQEWRLMARPGNIKVRDHRYWVPLVMLYSGARPAEIAQLAVADVREDRGHWIMHITTEGDGEKSVKTKGSMRVVPVHPELVRLGFINHRERMAQAGQARLFPDAVRNSRGQMMADFSREFGRYLTRIGLKQGRGLSLYSFRHGVADAFRRAGFLDDQFGMILGHSQGTMTGRYGLLNHGILEKRVQLVNAIDYPGLDISHLNI